MIVSGRSAEKPILPAWSRRPPRPYRSPESTVRPAESGPSQLSVEGTFEAFGQVAEGLGRCPQVCVFFLEMPDAGQAVLKRSKCLRFDHCASSDANDLGCADQRPRSVSQSRLHRSIAWPVAAEPADRHSFFTRRPEVGLGRPISQPGTQTPRSPSHSTTSAPGAIQRWGVLGGRDPRRLAQRGGEQRIDILVGGGAGTGAQRLPGNLIRRPIGR